MKLVSLNLWNGGRLFEAVREFIVQQNADIYFFQEAYDGHGDIEERLRTVEIFQNLFPNYHSNFAPVYLDTRLKEGKIEDGQLILSRWPLSNPQNIFLDLPYAEYDQDGMSDFSRFPATIQKAETVIEGKKVTLLNVHGPVNFNGTEDDPRRLKMRDLILAEVGEHSIVAGDFNVRPETETIRGLETKLQSVFGLELKTTFNTRRKDLVAQPGYAKAAVDMCFVSPGIEIKSKKCLDVDVSDHLPLVVELAIS
jgi:endonuclease/exonuclease/phosphatase family metal-dependent hydrolase